ncbi:hypothetical protein JMF94_01095 [Desulfovibrio sp. UIB00]|uniref:hypothetical protein n=1 Tax=Desulfovibrio sp. UIB00 TaxID=2804314 RepID=UPI001F0FA83F|nr:hypothetical protein [Desulfovibrio sp. UIB00]MCH5143674.1 hypothetical protein [Desulfovibrio sp. UIB00]
MPAPADTQVQGSTLLWAHWPVIVALIIAFLGWWLLMRETTSAVVMTAGMAGMLVCLPLFKQEKNPWLYVAVLVLCSTGTLVDAKHLTDAIGLEWLPRRTAAMISLSVQGFVASFVYLLLHLYIFRLKGRAGLLAKVPPCMLFMTAALYPAAALFWLFLAAIGLAPLC